MEPTNYFGYLNPVAPVTAGLDQFQQEQAQSAQRALLANQYQQQLRTQQLQQAALQDAITNPSPQAYRNMLLVNPQAHEAIKAAYDGLDEETQRSQLQDMTAVQGYLGAGQPDKAQAILQQHIAAAKRAGQPTTAYDSINDLISSNPKYAQALVGMTLAGTAGADKMAQTQATFGKEARDQAGFPTDQALKRAQADQAEAEARKASYATVGVDQSLVPLPGAPGAPAPAAGSPAAQAPATSRGVRNNNPLNVQPLAKGQWPGQTGTDGQYAVFATPQAGWAAADANLKTYGSKYGINTLSGVINRWAPQAAGNDTAAYVQTVANDLGIDPNAKLDLSNPQTRRAILQSMSKVELGGAAPTQGGQPGQVQPIFQGPMANPQDAQLSPEAVDMAAFNYLRYGPSALQNLGQGKTGVLNKNRIMDRVAAMAREAGTSNPELVASWAQNKANGEALTQNTKNLTQISASENTLNANLDFAMGLAKRGLGPTGVPYLDMPINKIRIGLGSADAKTLDNVLTTSADEYARILSGSPSGAGAGTSDSARAEAHKLINNGMTLRQLTDAINAAKTEAANRRQAYVNENTRLTGEISGRLQTGQPTQAPTQPTPGGQPAAPAAPKVGDVQQGYRFKGGNPADPHSWAKL